MLLKISIQSFKYFFLFIEIIYNDPVIDPRETWGKFFSRILEFEDPPLVERNELPREMQPQNRFLGKLRSYINGMSPYPEPSIPLIEEYKIEFIK